MNKSTQKNKKWNSLVVNKLSEKHGFTIRFINQCLNNDRTSQTSDTIRREYKELTKKIEETLNQ